MSKRELAIGIDLGATNLKAGLVTRAGKIVASEVVALGKNKSPAAIANLIARQVRAFQRDEARSIVAVGVGVPGIVDFERGIVHSSPNLPAWKNVPVRALFSKKIGLPTVVDNDANMHAVGEHRFGAGRGRRNMVLLTLGTGIGGGLILNGEIFHGDEGLAGEVGHIIIEPNGAKCGCGRRGCWERYAASHAFEELIGLLPEHERQALAKMALGLKPDYISILASGGNKAALKLWKYFGRYLGAGISILLNTLGVETFVVGGGISKSFELFGHEAKKSALSHTYKYHSRRLVIRRAVLGNKAGIVGAAIEALSKAAI